MNTTRKRVNLLREIGSAQALAGLKEAAEETFDTAVEIARTTVNNKDRLNMLLALAVAQAENDIESATTFDAARQASKRIGSKKKRAKKRLNKLIEIAYEQQKLGEPEAALETLESIPGRWERAEALRAVAAKLARTDFKEEAQALISRALDAAQQIGPEKSRLLSLGRIVKTQVKFRLDGSPQNLSDADMEIDDLNSEKVQSNTMSADYSLTEVKEVGVVRGPLLYDENTRPIRADGGSTTQVTDRYSLPENITDFIEVLQKASGLEPEDARQEALLAIAVVQAQTGRIEEALKTLFKIHDEEIRTWTLIEIGTAQVQSKDFGGALLTAKGVTGLEDRVRLLIDIATAQADSQDSEASNVTFASALEIARRIASAEKKAEMLQSIAVAQGMLGLSESIKEIFAEALGTAEEVEDLALRIRIQQSIALCESQVGLGNEARSIFSAGSQIVKDIADQPTRNKVLEIVAMAQIEIGQFSKAQRTIEKIADSSKRGEAMGTLVSAQARSQRFDAALQTVKLIPQKWRRTLTMGVIAVAQAEAGLVHESKDSLLKAIDSIQEIKESSRRESALQYIALTQAHVKDFTAAIEIAQIIDDELLRVETLGMIALGQSDIEEGKQAESTFSAAYEIAQNINDENQRAIALRKIAVAQAQAGFSEQAVRTAEAILINRNELIPEIATSLAAFGYKEHLKKSY